MLLLVHGIVITNLEYKIISVLVFQCNTTKTKYRIVLKIINCLKRFWETIENDFLKVPIRVI